MYFDLTQAPPEAQDNALLNVLLAACTTEGWVCFVYNNGETIDVVAGKLDGALQEKIRRLLEARPVKLTPIRIMADPGEADHVSGGNDTKGTTAWAYNEWLDLGAMADEPHGIPVWREYVEHMAENGYHVLDAWQTVNPGGYYRPEFTGDFSAGYGVEVYTPHQLAERMAQDEQ